jgi:hypothetical protein
MGDYTNETKKISGKKVLKKIINRIVHPNIISLIVVAVIVGGLFFSYYETRKKSILVNIELYNVDEQIKNHFY